MTADGLAQGLQCGRKHGPGNARALEAPDLIGRDADGRVEVVRGRDRGSHPCFRLTLIAERRAIE